MAKVTSLIQINIDLPFSFEWNIKKWRRRRRRRKRSEFGFSGRITSVESTLSPLFPVSLWILHQLPSQGREARSPSTLPRRSHLSPSFPRFDDIESSCWKYNRIVRLLANWDKPPISDSREGKQIFHSLRSTLRSISDPAMARSTGATRYSCVFRANKFSVARRRNERPFRISGGEGSRRNNISVNRDSIIQIFHYRISIMTLAILQASRMKRARCKMFRVLDESVHGTRVRKRIAFRLSFVRLSFISSFDQWTPRCRCLDLYYTNPSIHDQRRRV